MQENQRKTKRSNQVSLWWFCVVVLWIVVIVVLSGGFHCTKHSPGGGAAGAAYGNIREFNCTDLHKAPSPGTRPPVPPVEK